MRRRLLRQMSQDIDITNADIERLKRVLKRALIDDRKVSQTNGDGHRCDVFARKLHLQLLNGVSEYSFPL